MIDERDMLDRTWSIFEKNRAVLARMTTVKLVLIVWGVAATLGACYAVLQLLHLSGLMVPTMLAGFTALLCVINGYNAWMCRVALHLVDGKDGMIPGPFDRPALLVKLMVTVGVWICVTLAVCAGIMRTAELVPSPFVGTAVTILAIVALLFAVGARLEFFPFYLLDSEGSIMQANIDSIRLTEGRVRELQRLKMRLFLMNRKTRVPLYPILMALVYRRLAA